MSLGPGTRVGPYEIQSAIGAGGMGEVYRARDTRLGREVAIKALPVAFSSDADRLARFEQEARAAAALNHPNILAVHDIGTHEGAPYIVSELLEGDTLRQRISGMPVRKAIDYAIQIAHGLAAAHEKGIVHRDLKPENIFVTTDGRVKILDFGLAKLTQADAAAAGMSELPTTPAAVIGRAAPQTAAGVVLGTVGYMAPEQVRGVHSDHRADIFALGTILYEMLSGRRAFQGETSMDTLTAILKEAPPDLPTVERHIPPALTRIVERCLEKSPAGRFQSSRDLVFALEGLSSGGVSSAQAVQPHRFSDRLRSPWFVAGIAGAAAAALMVPAALYLLRPVASSVLAHLDIVTPPTNDPNSVALSPDGKWIVFAANSGGKRQLWLRGFDSSTARPLVGTDEGMSPFWSPDSRAIGFFSLESLKRIDLSGGQPRTIARSIGGGVGGSWNRDGTIIFHQNGGLGTPIERVSENGGEATPVIRADERQTRLSYPQFLPDGRHFLYFALAGSQPGVYVGALDGSEPRRLIEASAPAVYSAGYLLILNLQGTLFAQQFDPDTLTLMGEQIQLATDAQGVTASETGVLAYRSGSFIGRRQFAWFDRSGKLIHLIGTPDDTLLGNPQLSPDNRYVAFDRIVDGNADVWLLDVAREVLTRFTITPGPDMQSVWFPDGGRLAFASLRGKPVFNVFVKRTSGVGAEEMLLESPVSKFIGDWSRDGHWLLFQPGDLKTGRDLWAMHLEGDRRSFAIANTEFEEREGQFSPDGRWVAYASSVSGRFEIYIQPFPDPVSKWQISAAGGEHPRWRGDGKELFYLAPDGTLMAAPIAVGQNGERREPTTPVALFKPRIVPATGGSRQQYAVTSDGQRFLIVVPEEVSTSSIAIIQNWTTALGK